MEKRLYMKSEDVAHTPSYVRKTSHTSRIIFVLIFLLLIVVLVLIGLYFLGSQSMKSEKQALIPTPTSVAETPTSPPSPTPALVRKDLSIAVLNGSGVAGAASEIATYLKELGYTVQKTGNATRFDYEGITVLVSEEKKDYLSLLQTDLSEKFASVSASISGTLTTDAEVIVGK